MRWIAKAAVQKALGFLPAGPKVNYWMQRRITGGLPRSDEHFRYQATETLRHLEAWRRFGGGRELGEARLYEFGAGWDLSTPLIFYGLGARSQTLVDLHPHARLEEINHSLDQYRRMHDWLSDKAGFTVADVGAQPLGSLAELKPRFGIDYLAPRDARATGLAAASVDLATSTNTLEHIPRAQIAPIFTETRRLLVPGGIISGLVDMQDHYSFFDSSISAFNYLKFSDATWRLINSPLHFQNRLRITDYRELVANAGLNSLAEVFKPPSAEDLATIDGMSLSKRFRAGYAREDLAVRAAQLIATADEPRHEPSAAS
jgi:hypothetical protein